MSKTFHMPQTCFHFILINIPFFIMKGKTSLGRKMVFLFMCVWKQKFKGIITTLLNQMYHYSIYKKNVFLHVKYHVLVFIKNNRNSPNTLLRARYFSYRSCLVRRHTNSTYEFTSLGWRNTLRQMLNPYLGYVKTNCDIVERIFIK